MKRNSIITAGVLLVLIGVQLNLVDTYTLTPKATKFWAEKLAKPADLAPLQAGPARAIPATYNPNLYQQASYGNSAYASYAPTQGAIMLRQKQITPPHWICWPVIFVGAVLTLQGALIRD